ncbi:MAG: hypothetical protein Q8R55_04095 [Candidatus Taylorbacteria bacterium]|nr:hypothetical protein [Candidatus Taylorbacteria bacterium]
MRKIIITTWEKARKGIIWAIIFATFYSNSFGILAQVWAQEKLSPSLLTVTNLLPDQSPELFYLESWVDAESGWASNSANFEDFLVTEPDALIIKDKKFIPYRLYEADAEYYIEVKSRDGSQIIKVSKNKPEYGIFEGTNKFVKLAEQKLVFEYIEADAEIIASSSSQEPELSENPVADSTSSTSSPQVETASSSEELPLEPVVDLNVSPSSSPIPLFTISPTPLETPTPEVNEVNPEQEPDSTGSPQPEPETTPSIIMNKLGPYLGFSIPEANAQEVTLAAWQKLNYSSESFETAVNLQKNTIIISQNFDLIGEGRNYKGEIKIELGFDGQSAINKWTYGVKNEKLDTAENGTNYKFRVKADTVLSGNTTQIEDGVGVSFDLELVDDGLDILELPNSESTPKQKLNPEITSPLETSESTTPPPSPEITPSPELTPEATPELSPTSEPTSYFWNKMKSILGKEAMAQTTDVAEETVIPETQSTEEAQNAEENTETNIEPNESAETLEEVESVEAGSVETPTALEEPTAVEEQETVEDTNPFLEAIIDPITNLLNGENDLIDITPAVQVENNNDDGLLESLLIDLPAQISDAVSENLPNIASPSLDLLAQLTGQTKKDKIKHKIKFNLGDHKGKKEIKFEKETKNSIAYLYQDEKAILSDGYLLYIDPSFGAETNATGVTVQTGDGTKGLDFKIHFNSQKGGAIDALYTGGNFVTNKVAQPDKESGGLTLINIGGDYQTDYQSTLTIEEQSKVRVVVKNEVTMASASFSELYSIYPTGRIIKKIQINKGGTSEEQYFFNAAKALFDTTYLDTDNFGQLIISDNADNKSDLLAYWQDPLSLASGSYAESEDVNSFNTIFTITESEVSRTIYQLIELGKDDLSLLNPVSYAGYPIDYRNPDDIGPTFKKGSFYEFNFGNGAYAMEAVDNTVIFTLNGSQAPRFQPIFEIYNWTSDDFKRFIATLNKNNLIEGVHFAVDFKNGDRNTTTLLFQYFGVIGPGQEFTVNGFGEFNIDPTIGNTRANTVEYFAGQYSGNGTSGQASSTKQTLSSFNFRLSESTVAIKSAFIVFETQYEAYTNITSSASYQLAFDACSAPCTPNAWTGTGKVLSGTASVTFTYDEGESSFGRMIASVSTEGTLATYTGGTLLTGQVGYEIGELTPVTANYIAQANARLVINYTYSDTNSTNETNTVIYPLESEAAGDEGTNQNNVAGNCTKNTNCPTYDYNVDLGESSTASVSHWFTYKYLVSDAGTNDVVLDVNINGTNIDTSDVVFEGALGNNGNPGRAEFYSVPGFLSDTAQVLEASPFTGGAGDNMWLSGGEVAYTYVASASQAVKTKTVSYPIGVVTNDIVANTTYTASASAYFPEQGVSVKKAWFRIIINQDAASVINLDVFTKVGINATTASSQYNTDAATALEKVDHTIYHVIPSTDYAQLELASGKTKKDVGITVQANNNNFAGVSAELMITYTYTSDATGYISSNMVFAGQQKTVPNNTFAVATGAIDPSIPETSGSKFIRGSALLSSVVLSDSDGVMITGNLTLGASLSAGGCSTSNVYATNTDGQNTSLEWHANVKSIMTTSDSQTYTACYSQNDGGDNVTVGGVFNGILIYTYQIDLPKYTQSAYRFFSNDNATTVTTALANQDTAATLTSDAQIFRLRMLVDVASGSLAINGDTFKLQAAERSGTCDTAFSGETYADITTTTSISYDTTNTPSDGDDLTINSLDPEHGTHATKSQDYEEANNFSNTVSAIASSQDGLWDFALKDNDGDADGVFCLRAVRSDGVLFTVGSGSYAVIPQITMAAAAGGNPTYTQNAMLWYANTDGLTPSDAWSPGSGADFAENFATISAQFAAPDRTTLIRLRQSILVGTANLNAASQSFKIQFAEVPTGTVGCGGVSSWTDVGASTSSEVWRFGSNVSVRDGTTLTTLRLSVSDVAATYEEGNNTSTNPNSATTNQDLEYDFSLENNSADGGATYCFRMSRTNGNALDGYNRFPVIITPPGQFAPEKLLRHGNFFTDQGYEQPYFWGGI